VTTSQGLLIEQVLERTLPLGYEIKADLPVSLFGVRFIGHAPMAAEALVTLGVEQEQVFRFIENYIQREHHYPAPSTVAPIDPNNWKVALGNYERVSDWALYFQTELERQEWQNVLATWGPRLMPGAMAGLTHGLIRTMHATRSLANAKSNSSLSMQELSKGLALWASKYTESSKKNSPKIDQSLSTESVNEELTRLIVANANNFLYAQKKVAVPLVHSLTAPAAFRFLLNYFPAETHPACYQALVGAVNDLLAQFRVSEHSIDEAGVCNREELISDALKSGDEHVIKLTEAALREAELGTPDVVLRAAHHAAVCI
jgi:Questin oxidase-like